MSKIEHMQFCCVCHHLLLLFVSYNNPVMIRETQTAERFYILHLGFI